MDSHVEIEKHGFDEDLQRLFRNAPNIKIDTEVDIDASMKEVNVQCYLFTGEETSPLP